MSPDIAEHFVLLLVFLVWRKHITAEVDDFDIEAILAAGYEGRSRKTGIYTQVQLCALIRWLLMDGHFNPASEVQFFFKDISDEMVMSDNHPLVPTVVYDSSADVPIEESNPAEDIN